MRVGIDSSLESGNWNAPVNTDTNEFAYVPIRENNINKKMHPGMETSYDEFKDSCRNFGITLPFRLQKEFTHLDPDFSYLSYGDQNARGKPLDRLNQDDLLVFYAGLKPIKQCEHKIVYALIGLYVVDRVVSAKEIAKRDWHRNAHTRRVCDDTDLVVFGKPNISGRLERCLVIGEYRENAYRVRKELLEEWGGLTVNDGWIQRSAVLPQFKEPVKFKKWFEQKGIGLMARNN